MMSEQTSDLSKALAKAQGEMGAAKFNKINPHFKNKYADLSAVIDAIRKPLADNGIGYTQVLEHWEVGMVLVTRLHFGEQWIASAYPMPTGVTPQAFGSALTYARRYSLSALCGIAADEDDDAEAVEGASKNANGALITEEQRNNLQDMVLEVYGEKGEAFLKGLFKAKNIKKLADLKAGDYDIVAARIEDNRGQVQ